MYVPSHTVRLLPLDREPVEVEDHDLDYIDFEGDIEEGQHGAGSVKIWDRGEYDLLEFFEVDSPVRVTFRTDELEALCPAVEGVQPDIYNAEISYTAQTHAVESKSLKLWLVTFRDRRIFAYGQLESVKTQVEAERSR